MIVLKQPSNACATLMFHIEFNIVVKAFKIVDGLIGFCFYFVSHILLINEWILVFFKIGHNKGKVILLI